MNLQPLLENELVQLRPLEAEDFAALYLVARDPLIWEQHPNADRYKIGVFTLFFKASLESGGALVAVEQTGNKIIGGSRFNTIDGHDNAIEIGWSFLSRDYWGGKYNQAMKKLMIDHAFESMETVLFFIGKANIRSQKAVEKIGGIQATEAEFLELVKDRPDDLVYCLNKKDWTK